MEFLATLASYIGSLLSPEVFAVATVMTLVFLSGLGAGAIDWGERIGRGIRRQLAQDLEAKAPPSTSP